NAAGQVSQVTDPGGRSAVYGYDASGQHLISVTGKSGTASYAYLTGQGNAARNNALSQITYPDGTQLVFGYDAFGRLSDSHGAGGQQDLSYTYGAGGGYTVTDAD